MIQPLRKAHRTTFVVLAIALPLVLAAAIASRKPVTNTNLASQISAASQTIGEFRFLFDGKRASLALIHISSEPNGRYALRSELREASRPETLLYWSPSEGKDVVPANAVLMAPVAIDRAFIIPEKYAATGWLLLYDAPHKRVLAQLSLGNR